MRTFGLPSLLALLLGALGAHLASCSNETVATSTPNPKDASAEASANACAAGFAPGPTGDCEPLLPKADCAPGSMPTVGNEKCVAVGWTICPNNFVFDPAKGSCVDSIPNEPCSGNTMETVSAGGCLPIDRCGAFPPPGAKYFVSAAYAASEIDSTHFATIGAAVAAASAGSTIAIADGTYSENVVITKNVDLVGHCSSKVKVSGGNGRDPAFLVQANVALAGVTIEGYLDAIVVESGPFHLEGALLENNVHAALYLQGDHATTLSSVVVRGTREATPGDPTVGVLVFDGAGLTMNRAAFADNVGGALGVTGAASVIRASLSIFRNTVPRSDGVGGSAIRAYEGASFDIRDSVIASNQGVPILIDGKGTSGKLAGVVVRDTKLDPRSGGSAMGLSVSNGASADVAESGFLDTPAAGIVVGGGSKASLTKVTVSGTSAVGGMPAAALGVIRGATATVTQSAFLNNKGFAVSADGSDVSLTESLVAATKVAGAKRVAIATGSSRGGRLTIKSSAFVQNEIVGLGATGTGSTLALERVLVDRTTDTQGAYGHGLYIAASATLTADMLVARNNVGAALLLSSAAGLVRSSFILDNAIGVQAQSGTKFEEVAMATEVNPLAVRVSSDTVFRGNKTKLGADTLPLPAGEQ